MSIKTRVKSLLLFKLRKQLLIYFYLKTVLKDLSSTIRSLLTSLLLYFLIKISLKSNSEQLKYYPQKPKILKLLLLLSVYYLDQ